MTETLSPALPAEIESLTHEVLQAAHDAGLALVTAESCTGGLLASILTDVDGLAHAFDRGFVTYSTASKHALLGVPCELLERWGPVSEPVARAMAEGALARSDGHIAVAVTGFAGPAGPDEPQGRVHFALARRGGPTAHRHEEFGPVGRGEGRLACLRVALGMIAEAIASTARAGA
jgi:nicotinamide-nucleotide amidase